MSKPAIISAEEALESGKSLVKKTGKNIAKSAGDTAKAAVSQITGAPSDTNLQTDQHTKDFVKDLYGKTINNNSHKTSNKSQQANTQTQSPDDSNKNLSSEEQQELMNLRKKLHDEVYYDKLVNPRKGQPEERPAEKVEKEKQEEMIELQKKEEKKPPPLAVQRAMTKTEKFPGGGG